MKLIIDIDKKLKSAIYRCGLFLNPTEKVSLIDAINNGTHIPDNATNGDVIKAIFPQFDIRIFSETGIVLVFGENKKFQHFYPIDWWNAPYTTLSEGKE